MTYIGDSTADSSTSAAPRSASATSPTTSPGHCSKPEGSDPRYTLNREEPLWIALSVGRVADGASVEDYLAWRDRVVGALRGHDAVRPQLADALGAHVAQKLAAAGAPLQVSERSAAVVREAAVTELNVPVF